MSRAEQTPVGEPGGAYPDRLRERVDAYLATIAFGGGPATAGLERAMEYSLLAGGKRIRPVLTLAAAEAHGRDAAELLPLAAALELIHTYSLIHDDLPAMDDDALRRGRPTLHVAHGEDVAILAGDALFAEAIRHLVEHQAGPPDRVLAAVAHLAGAAGVGGMVGGQYMDVIAEAEPTAERIRELHERKTGRLIAAAVECVLLLEGKNRPATIPLGRFAAELGVLFQIVDDILDVTGEEESLGKPRGSDERHDKSTYVSVFGLDGARKLAGESHAKALAALDEAAVVKDTLADIADYILTRQR